MLSGARLANHAYSLIVHPDPSGAAVRLEDLAARLTLSDGPYQYRVVRCTEGGSQVSEVLSGTRFTQDGSNIRISGTVNGLALAHVWELPPDGDYLEEHITLSNHTDQPMVLQEVCCSLQRVLGTGFMGVAPELRSDRLVALPFRHRPADPRGTDQEYPFVEHFFQAGREYRAQEPLPIGIMPPLRRHSEGWAWLHGSHSIGIFKFNQEALEFSAFAFEMTGTATLLRFGGVHVWTDEASRTLRIEPGGELSLGVTRYQTVEGGYEQAAYAFRAFLDQHGCRFPPDYNPPVHWEELYDNAEYRLGSPGRPPMPRRTRPFTYTREQLLGEAAKGQEYSCEALYLDPGWDTEFATFLWGEEWLGDAHDFIETVRQHYGLAVSLHTPLAPWLSLDKRGVASWPESSWRMDRQGKILSGQVCLSSRQYLDEAERRLLALCAHGVAFLMFDGNWWPGSCWNPDHGHPVPLSVEDHSRANVDLAQRVHKHYPKVLIEMHDMVAGGNWIRPTPVYWKYGLPGSYDENWCFELMWRPMQELQSGRAAALYYYSLGCNIPVYLHIDLRDDNEHGLLLWWYASTCRHLGIGGTHDDPRIAEAQKRHMQRYRRLDRFFKRGDFWGVSEEIHIHTLPGESDFVVNLFNLSDQARVVEGTANLRPMGLDLDRWYVIPYGGGFDAGDGTFSISRRMAPWSAQVVEVSALAIGQRTPSAPPLAETGGP